MLFQSVFNMTPFLVAMALAAPIAQGTAPGTVAIAGSEPDCYYPHGEDSHEMICTYTSSEPGHYPVITSNIPDSCGPDPEDDADIVCYLPGKPELASRSTQDAYTFRFWCDVSGCHTSTKPKTKNQHNKRAPQDLAKADLSKLNPIQNLDRTKIDLSRAKMDAYKLTIEWKRDLEDNMSKREAMQEAYNLSIRIRVSW